MALNKTQLEALKNTNLPDNSSGQINPEGNRALVQSMIDSIYGTVTSISDLKAYDITSLNDGDQVRVLNFDANTNGGGNVFTWDSTNTTTSSNKYYGFTTIKPNSLTEGQAGRWKRKSDKERVTLREFGVASFDSSVDASSALQTIFPDNVESNHLFVDGRYYIAPNQFQITKFQSSSIVGRATGFNTYFRPYSNTAGWLIYLGDPDGSVSCQDSLLRDFGIDLRHPDSTDSVDRVSNLTGIYLRYANILNFDNIDVRNIGSGGKGIESKPNDGLMQELYFRRLQFNSGDNGGFSNGSYGFYMFPTGNIELHQCNLESIDTSIYMRYQRYETLSIHQCFFERTNKILDVDGCRVDMNASSSQGNIWLGNSVYGSDINLLQNSTSDNAKYRASSSVCDNGIGNKIVINSSAGKNESDLFYTGINFDGSEWLKAGVVNTDPFFKEGITGWTTNNASKSRRVWNIKNLDNGLAMLVTASSIDGYAEYTQEVSTTKEHLVNVGLVFNSGNGNNVRVELYDSSNTLIHNSGTIDFGDLGTRSGHKLYMYRKWVPAQAGGEIKVRIVVEDSGDSILCPFFTINESEITIADIKDSGGSSTVNGSGATRSVTKTLRSGEKLQIDNSTNNNKASKYLVRFKADANAFFGAENDYNNNNSWSHYSLFNEEREYVMLIPAGAQDYFLYWFGSDKEITISDVSVHRADSGGDTFTDTMVFENGLINKGKDTRNDNGFFLDNIGTNNNFTFATSDVDTATDRITKTAHGMSTNDAVQLTSSGTLPSGLTTDTLYVIKVDNDTFQLSTERNGSSINITTQGSGTHKLRKISVPITVKLPDSFCGTALKIYCYGNSGGTINESTVLIRREGSGTANIDSVINEIIDTMNLTITLNEIDDETVDLEFIGGTSNTFAYMWYDVKTFSGAYLETR
jgi:hypothetical protein